MQGPNIPTPTTPPVPRQPKDTVSVSSQIPTALGERLKAQVAREERTQSVVVRRALEMYLDKEGA